MFDEIPVSQPTQSDAVNDTCHCNTAQFSMSESLAVGLVKRMISENKQNYHHAVKTRAAQMKKEKITTVPSKRTAAYRFLTRRTLALIPEGHQVLVHTIGKQDGTDRHAKFSIIHWSPTVDDRTIHLAITYIAPQYEIPRRWTIFELTTHALQRLFYRLKCVEQGPVLEELKQAVIRTCSWFDFFINLIHSCPDVSIGVPTPNGILYFKQSDDVPLGSPAGLVASTWVSDIRMEDRPEKLEAVRKAREMEGFVMQYGQRLIAVTQEHCLEDLATAFKPYNSIYFDEMLNFLPNRIPFKPKNATKTN